VEEVIEINELQMETQVEDALMLVENLSGKLI